MCGTIPIKKCPSVEKQEQKNDVFYHDSVYWDWRTKHNLFGLTAGTIQSIKKQYDEIVYCVYAGRISEYL